MNARYEQMRAGYAPDLITRHFRFVHHSDDPNDCRGTFSPVTLRSLQHPGAVLAVIDGVAVICLSEPNRMTLLLAFADRAAQQAHESGARFGFPGNILPAFAFSADESTITDLTPTYLQLMARLVELRQHGWQIVTTEKVRTRNDWDFTTRLINPLDDTTAVRMPVRVSGRKARRAITDLLDALSALPTTPQVRGQASSQQARLDRLKSHAQSTLAEHAAELQLKVAISAALTANPDTDIPALVEKLTHERDLIPDRSGHPSCPQPRTR